MKIRDIVEGDAVRGLVCTIKTLKSEKKEISLVLSDNEKEISATVSKNLYDFAELSRMKGRALLVDGLMNPGLVNVRKPSLKVKLISVSENEQDKKDALPHIAEERLKSYIETIKRYANTITEPFYKALINAYFSKENLRLMKDMPATHIRQGTPGGGMLQATCSVLEIAAQTAFYYLRNANGYYSFNDKAQLDWDLLFTGAILHLAGNLTYFSREDGLFDKDIVSVEMGYNECRTEVINNLILQYKITYDREAYCSLMGVMSTLNEQKVGIKGCRQESSILYHAYNVALSLDSFDQETFCMAKDMLENGKEKDTDEKVTAAYSDKLGCYVSAKELVRKKEAIQKREVV